MRRRPFSPAWVGWLCSLSLKMEDNCCPLQLDSCKNLNLSSNDSFLKRCAQEQVFSAGKKGLVFSILVENAQLYRVVVSKPIDCHSWASFVR